MRLSFLELPGHERRLYFEQAAARRGLSAVVLEKDFWVCWLLGVLFRSEPGLSTQLTRPAVRRICFSTTLLTSRRASTTCDVP
jgi:hypothetical protein